MFKRAFNQFLDKPIDKPELYPYIYSIGLKGLTTEAKKKIKTQPIQCSQCGAVLTNVKSIKEDPKIGTHYKCEYCETINVISKDQIIEGLPDDIEIIIEDIKPKEPKEDVITKVSATEGDLYIAVIDISGSMSGAKIESVKRSLVQTIKDFKINAAGTKFILIAFESSVYYYLRHDKDPTNFSGDLLFSLEGMRDQLEKAIKKKELGSIGEFADGWVRKVESLRSRDMTALGPALYMAIISFDIFEMKTSGRITLLTDGLANQGIGNLSGTSIGADKFYDQLGDLCNQYNIIVDIVGVTASGDNNEMGLQVLGQITDKTGGTMFLISSDEMEAVFSQIQQTNYIGRDVRIKLITPTSINIKNVTGAFSSRKVKESQINLGAVTKDRELFVELESPKGLKGIPEEEIPIQLQVEYQDKEGRKKLRVVNDKVKITKNEDEFKSEYDQKLNVMMNIQSAGQQYYAGKAKNSKTHLNSLRNELMGELKSLHKSNVKFSEKDFSEGIEYLEDELEEMEIEEEKQKSAPKASYQAAMGQSHFRMSEDLLQERMKRKKKK
jgi:Mg-chelatase subunit ChlD